jgi:predicted DCC family thiol-disulfide oxidoreductase YuxK
MAMNLPGPTVLYDGECGLCHRSVKFLIKRDRGQLWYAPLQGETAAELRAEHPQIPETLESVVLVDGGRVYLRSKAFFHSAKYLTRPWRWAYHLRWLPAFLLDLVYALIARVRYGIWGKYDTCTLPTTDQRAHLLP